MNIALDQGNEQIAESRSLTDSARVAGTRFAQPWVLATILGISLTAWLIAALVSSRYTLVVIDPGEVFAERRLVAGGVVAGGLALLGLSHAASEPRLRWMSFGIVLLALGGVLFGDVLVNSTSSFTAATALYGSTVTRGGLVALTAIGLIPAVPPLLTWRLAALLFAGYLLLVACIAQFADRLPQLASFDQIPPEPSTGPTPGFTALYWLLVAVTITMAISTTVAAVRISKTWEVGAWFVLAVTLLTGMTAHSAFRPSLFGISTEYTTSNVIATTMIILLILGSTFNLRMIADRISSERDALAEETRRLTDLARLRADFTTMVAHELAQPLVAIRRSAELLQSDELRPDQHRSVDSIVGQATSLFAMIDDVRSSATAETELLSLDIEQTSVGRLFDTATTFGQTLSGNHPIRREGEDLLVVWADAMRIDQVLRNLLTNASLYTPQGSPIVLRALPVRPGAVRFEVEDEGPGIDESELPRFFERYGRGSSDEPGLGVGLHVCRRILQAFGSELSYRRGGSGGACFWFELPRVSA